MKSKLTEGQEGQTGRPYWSNGACLYLTPEDAEAIDWSDERQRQELLEVPLQSKHVVCSKCYYDLIERVLHNPPRFTGREAFLIKRAGVIKERVLKPFPPVRSWRSFSTIMKPCFPDTQVVRPSSASMRGGRWAS